MGGIRDRTIDINCDRCGKDVPVESEEQTKFYREFAKRDDKDEFMFSALLISPDGKTKDVGIPFEWLCPKCVSAIDTLMRKINPKLVEAEKPPVAVHDPSTEKKAGGKVQEKQPVEPEKPPSEPVVAEEPGQEVADDELFD